MEKSTLISLSQRTGFSISTISRALNGQAAKYRISPETVAIIKAEADRCGYTPSIIAKSLRTKSTHTIGLIIPCIGNPYFAMIASVVTAEAKRMGYTIIIVDSTENEADEQDGIRSLVSRKVDGIIAVPCGNDPSRLESISASTPVVLIDRYYENSNLPYVCSDNYEGSCEAVNYLINNGHRNILCIQGNLHTSPTRHRVKGFIDTMQAAGLGDCANVCGNSFSIDNGYLETKLALNSTNPPTAIFALSNTILLGAIKAIRESQLRIPQDISVISFDHSIQLDFIDPPVTHISQPITNIGTLAIKVLMQEISNRSQKAAQIKLPVKMVIRDSVRNLLQPKEQ
ncbi:MAG: LacI family DNA-binding transcriptional regulator [Alistipes sp.]|nr:LacI family DNA-binding transcriptional regulator [Alistipes sp.]